MAHKIDPLETDFPDYLTTEDEKWDYSIMFFGNAYKLDGRTIHPARIVAGTQSIYALTHEYDETCQCQRCLHKRIRLLKEGFIAEGWPEYTAAIKARHRVEARPFA